jgi:hypothetical protein
MPGAAPASFKRLLGSVPITESKERRHHTIGDLASPVDEAEARADPQS